MHYNYNYELHFSYALYEDNDRKYAETKIEKKKKRNTGGGDEKVNGNISKQNRNLRGDTDSYSELQKKQKKKRLTHN